MFLVNWKKHYYVPNIFYTDTNFNSTRKGKFFFLSDFVFKLIHKFCFKHILYYYIEYIFDRRLIDSCLNITNVLHKPNINVFSFYFLPFFKKLNKKINFKKLNLKIKFLVHFTYFNSLLINFKKEIISKSLFIFNFLFKKKVNKRLGSYLTLYFHSFFLFLNKIKKTSFSNDNILFLLYQIKYLKLVLNRKLLLFNSKHQLITFLMKYIKNILNYKSGNFKHINLKNKFSYFFYRCNLKNIDFNVKRIDTSYIYFNMFLKTFHKTLYYYFFLNKIIHLKYDNLLNYFNFNNLKLKKELVYIFKKKFSLFKKKISYIRFKHRKKFFFFLSTILSKRQWLIGPVNKIKMFKYITFISNRINSSFTELQIRHEPFYENKLSFFYNAVKIREHFFYFLGKRRYREEFLLLKNKKWYLKYYLNQFYNLNYKFFSYFYFELRKKFKIKLIKDLFLFLEYNISVFIKKHLFYSFSCFSSVYLNMNKVSVNFKNLFFIGDVINIKTTSYYYYERYIIFFNFLYFIDPILFKNKYNLLSLLYKKIYKYFSSAKDSLDINNNLPKLYSYNFVSLEKNKIIRFYITNIYKLLNLNYKLYIKSLFFFIFKYQLLSLNNKKNLDLNISNVLNNLDIKNNLYIYSFGKFLYQYNLVNFKRSLLLKKKKKIKFFPRKSSVGMNVYNWLSYKKRRNLVYKGKVSISFNKKVYNAFYLKKMFFLNKKRKNLKVRYFSNF